MGNLGGNWEIWENEEGFGGNPGKFRENLRERGKKIKFGRKKRENLEEFAKFEGKFPNLGENGKKFGGKWQKNWGSHQILGKNPQI